MTLTLRSSLSFVGAQFIAPAAHRVFNTCPEERSELRSAAPPKLPDRWRKLWRPCPVSANGVYSEPNPFKRNTCKNKRGAS
jgi:hypothetical protein